MRQVADSKLPVGAFRGIWFGAGLKSSWIFDATASADGKVLYVLDADKNGGWPLLRIQNWWTGQPEIQSVRAPGWSRNDAAKLTSLTANLALTPDGKYLVAIAAAEWNRQVRKPDAWLTVVDTSTFKIVKSIKASSQSDLTYKGFTVAGDLVVSYTSAAASGHGLLRKYLALSLPALQPISSCDSKGPEYPEHLSQTAARQLELSQDEADTKTCARFLEESGEPGMASMRWQLTYGSPMPPSDLAFAGDAGSKVVREFSSGNGSLLRLGDGDWLAMNAEKSDVALFTSGGDILKRANLGELLCDSQPVRGPAWDCSCSFDSLTSNSAATAIRCVTEHDSFLGGVSWLNQWIGVISTRDLSPLGVARPPRWDAEVRQVIADIKGQIYLGVVSQGERLTVFAVPATPRSSAAPSRSE